MIARRLPALAGALAVLLAAAAGARADTWQQWPLPVPAGGLYETAPGVPGDLSFWAPNRGLMTVGGANGVPEGIYGFDGQGWHQLAVVCGAGSSARIAWAGPDEFWTIARPSLPRPQGQGFALCHFKDGEVVGSYSTPEASDDPYAAMSAAACDGPDDCWFGGVYAEDGSGRRSGAFHLHWDGTDLRSVYGPQGRAVSDLLHQGGQWFESTYAGPTPNGSPGAVALTSPEPVPSLLHRISGTAFANDPFLPLARSGVPADGSELLALDGDGHLAWAVGGGTDVDGNAVVRPPLAARLDDGAWHELTLRGDVAGLSADGQPQVFTDVAAVPGTATAWATMSDTSAGAGAALLAPTVVHLAADGTVELDTLGDATKGAAARVACPAVDDCWVATARGYLYRLGGAPAAGLDTDPAFAGTITVRPNEAAAQAIPDAPPQDDSQLDAPPVELTPTSARSAGAGSCVLPSVVAGVRSKVQGAKRLRIVISFRLTRTATVGLTARRGGRVVARAKARPLRPGHRRLTLAVQRRRWPTKLSFSVREARPATTCPTGSDDLTVATGP